MPRMVEEQEDPVEETEKAQPVTWRVSRQVAPLRSMF